MNAYDNEQVIAMLYDRIKEAGTLSDAFGEHHNSYDIHFRKPMINTAPMNSTTHVDNKYNSIKDSIDPFVAAPTQVAATPSGLSIFSPTDLVCAFQSNDDQKDVERLRSAENTNMAIFIGGYINLQTGCWTSAVLP